MVEAADREEVEVFPLSRFTFGPDSTRARGALLLSCAGFDRRAIRAGVRRLRGVLEAGEIARPERLER